MGRKKRGEIKARRGRQRSEENFITSATKKLQALQGSSSAVAA